MSSQPTAVNPDLREQVIRFWAVVYNNDSDCVYYFFDWHKVLAAVDGSLRTYLDEGIETESVVKNLMLNLQDWQHRSFIPIFLTQDKNEFTVTIYRWEIDSTTPLFRVLSRCYSQVDDDTKLAIMALLSNSR